MLIFEAHLAIGENLVFEGVPYRVVDDVRVPQAPEFWFFYILHSDQGAELIIERHGNTYTALLPQDGVMSLDDLLCYAVTFVSATGESRFLRGTLPCAHGSDGVPFFVRGVLHAPVPITRRSELLLPEERGGDRVRPAGRDPELADKIYLPDGAGRIAFERAQAELELAPMVIEAGSGLVAPVGADVSADRIEVLEVRQQDSGADFRILLPDGERWVDAYEVAVNTVNGAASYYLLDDAGEAATFRVTISRDLTWILESRADAELDPELAIVFGE